MEKNEMEEKYVEHVKDEFEDFPIEEIKKTFKKYSLTSKQKSKLENRLIQLQDIEEAERLEQIELDEMGMAEENDPDIENINYHLDHDSYYSSGLGVPALFSISMDREYIIISLGRELH